LERPEDISVISENVLFLEGKRGVSLIHVSESELYFSAINESGSYNLYVINFLDNEIIMLDYDIFQRTQRSNGYIYYTKPFDWVSQSFRRVKIADGADGSPEDVAAVDGFYIRGEQFTLNIAYVADGNYFSSMAYRDANGNFTHTYIIKIDPSNEVRVIGDYLPPTTGLTWYENNLFFTGINLSEDGIYVVPDEGGMRRRLRTGSTTLLAISDGRIFFSTGRRLTDGIIDINYIPLCGCRKTNLFTGELTNVEVLGEWVYFIDLEDSSKIKRVDVYSGEIQSLTDGRVQGFIINDSGEWLYYQRTYLMGTQILRNQISQTELVYPRSLANIVCYGEMNILWDDGTIQYVSRVECNVLALYAIENNGSDMTQLAIFQPLSVEQGWIETEWCLPPHIFNFEVTDDWIILSLGEFQGSGNFFNGDLFRVRRDGSGRESFESELVSTKFFIANDWIYYNAWDVTDWNARWIRIRPDGTDKEILAGIIHGIYLYSDYGYFYGTHETGTMLNDWSPVTNFVRWQPNSSESTILFFGDKLPSFEDTSYIGFNNIKIIDDYVMFSVYVWGHRAGDSWRGSLLYSADYRVDRDGNNLVLINEEYHIY